MEHKYGYFKEQGAEFVVTDPATPRAFDNMLWNDAIFSNVQQTGVGYCDYQVGDKEAVQLLTGVGRICDFDVFGRDHLMSRLIYVRDNDTGEYWNVNWEPVRRKPDAYQCVHGLGHTTITSTTAGIESQFRIFVPIGSDPVELWTLQTRNTSARKRRLSIFVYNQFQFKFKWGFDSYGDMLFRSAVFSHELNAVIASKHPHRRPHDFLTGFLTADAPIRAFDGTRNAFVGLYSTLQNPEAVVRGSCTNTCGSSDATIGAAQFDLELAPGECQPINLMLGASDGQAGIAALRNRYLGRFEDCFQELTRQKAALVAHNHVQTPDEQFNRMVNAWIKQETLYGATWCRWGWNGYRDIVQHGYGVVTFEPTRTRAILLDALRYQYQSGLALRGWNPVDEKPYSDSALWLVFTLVAYLKETGDMDVLDEIVPYYDGGQATVREHIDQALEFLESNKGSHGLVLIKFGDWNDSLTAVGKAGRGESVWLSEAYAEALRQMAELADYQEDRVQSSEYLRRYQQLKQRINASAWDGAWYTRCFDDAGHPLGSNHNAQAKIFIEAQAWALIADIADAGRADQTIASCDKLLLTDLGYALLAPTLTQRDDRLGRISCLEPGTCENGTIYSHTNVWMILGLLRTGRTEDAYRLFKRNTPGYPASGADDPKSHCPPYVYANCYFGADHRYNRFQMEFTWITGSVAWYSNVLLQHMLGARAEFGGLRIDPRLPAEWAECQVNREFQGATYRIIIRNPDHLTGVAPTVILDGEVIADNLLPIFADGATHQVEVIYGSRPAAKTPVITITAAARQKA